MSTPKVYIIIVNYNQWADSKECLESVLKSTYTDFSVFLIDNKSGNNSMESLTGMLDGLNRNKNSLKEGLIDYLLLKKSELDKVTLSKLPKVTFIQNDVNNGFAAGNNVVLQLLKEENAYIWLLNPDMTIQENTLTELVEFALLQSPKTIIGAVVKYYAGNHKVFFYGGGKVNFSLATGGVIQTPDLIGELDYISGSCLFTNAASYRELGTLPERYFLYWEETDWCYRAKQLGYNLAVCMNAICYDKVSSAIGRSFMADYYYVRSGLLFVSKFNKQKIAGVLFFVMLRFLKRIITGKWKRARGVYKGTVDFLKMKPR